jgi:hypothetical protein
MRRLGVAVALGAAVAFAIMQPRPTLDVPQDVPEEVQDLVDATWDSYLAAFPAQRQCIGSVTVVLVRSVEGGAASYRAADRTISVEIPTTPERFPESLAHELGHHLESACGAQERLGEAFLDAQGFARDVPWSRGRYWFEIPSEYFAEAVAEIVNGERITHPDVITLEPAAIELVAAWGHSGSVPATP